MPLVQTRGAASAQGFGEFAQVTAPVYIEDVFSTYLYTGTGASQTITNGIDLAGKGGMVWTKGRTTARNGNIVDSARGVDKMIYTNDTGAEFSLTGLGYSSFVFGSTGYTNSGAPVDSENTYNFVSWTFRKQPKFFDIVTYTGDGTSGRNIPHSLASAPGVVIVKRTDAAGNWWTGASAVELANGGNPASTSANFALNTANPYAYSGAPFSVWAFASSATNFYVSDQANISSATYVAYLFASNAGGFGLNGTDNVISCGVFNTDASGNATVNLGYEPQWVMTKISSDTGNWVINDIMRGMPASQTSQVLYPNLSAAESSSIYFSTQPNATGFTTTAYANNPSQRVLYIAIRRGPMKVPTDATKVFKPMTRTGTGAATTVTGVGFTPDFIMPPSIAGGSKRVYDRLRGPLRAIYTNLTDAEATETNTLTGFDVMDGVKFGSSTGNVSGTNYIDWFFKRAPGFFDEVCYTGTGSVTTQAHNLTVAPQLIIWKQRSAASNWVVYGSAVGMGYLLLNQVDSYQADSTALFMNNTAPTASVFTVGSDAGHSNPKINASGATYVAYLFATLAGVSKVGSYTGNGTTQTIDCGFTGGARFVLIKRTDSTGDWYVYDTARGMTVLTDPYLFLNSTAAEVATLGSVTTVSTGFALNSTILAAINVNAGTYIFLAIA
jgi:hypothetical protein